MAPVLFNLYACLFVDPWITRVDYACGVGLSLKYKHDRKLFRRYTHTTEESRITELQFADDASLLATTREGAEEALHKYVEVAGGFGLSVSIPKTKVLVTAREARAADRTLNQVGDKQIDSDTYLVYQTCILSILLHGFSVGHQVEGPKELTPSIIGASRTP